jgi:hypothetical protein
MLILILIFGNFSTDYQAFINSPRSESIFVGLTRGEYRLADFRDDPVALWFWRSTTESPEADSLLKRSNIGQNFHLSALLRWEAREQVGYERIREKLDLAIRFDSTAIENVVSLIALKAKYRKYQGLTDILNLPILGNLRNQAFLITNIYLFLVLAVFLVGLGFICAKTIFYLPVLSHRLDPLKHSPFKNLLPFVILLIPALVLRHLYLIYVIYGLILALIMNRREKIWLRLNAVILIALFGLSFPVSKFEQFLKGGSPTYDLYKMVNYDSDIRIEPNSNMGKELMAYSLKRKGALEEAMSIYEDLYYHGYRTLEVANNLANIYTAFDEDARAETLYISALIHRRPIPYFNLALLKLKNIEYLESSKYMEEARQMGFSSLSKTPIDIGPTNRDFIQTILNGKEKLPPIFRPVLVIPIVLILLLSFIPLKFAPPFFCRLCGQPICAACQKGDEEEPICNDCQQKLDKTKSSDIQEDMRDSLNRRRSLTDRGVGYLVNLAAPGAGLIFRGRNFAGLVFLFITAMAWLPIVFSQLFVKPAGWIALSLESPFVLPAILITVVAYILSFLFMGEEHAA